MKRAEFLRFAAVAAAVIFAGCALPRRIPPSVPSISLIPSSRLPTIADDADTESLAKAAAHDLAYLHSLGSATVRLGDLNVDVSRLIDSVNALVAAKRESKDDAEFSARIAREFDVYKVSSSSWSGKAFFSSYYVPIIDASPKRTAKFRFPLYKRPPDLVDVDLAQFNSKFAGEKIVGRVAGGRLVPYYDRKAIDVDNVLAGKGLESAWLGDIFDRLDMQIQGSGILRYPDGTFMMAKYAANNGQPFKSVGLAMIHAGLLSRADISKAAIQQYLAGHPREAGSIVAQDPRTAFHDVVPAPDDGEPVGNIQQPLVAGRSIAIDPKFTPLGAIAFINVERDRADADGKIVGKDQTRRFVFCQDIGGAISGPGRVDFFAGHGEQAKAEASHLWKTGELYLLLKKSPSTN